MSKKSLSVKSGMPLPGSDICLLEVSVDVSLKIATKWYLRGKKAPKIFSPKQKRTSTTKEIEVPPINMALRCSATYFLEAGVKAATKGSLRGKKKSENLDFTVVSLK